MPYEFKHGYQLSRIKELEGGSKAPPKEVLNRDKLMLFELNRLEETRESLNIECCRHKGEEARVLKASLDVVNGDFKKLLDELNLRSGTRFIWV
jgi:hypothetical protein